MNKNNIEISKFISLILRHQPQTIDLKLDNGGWANVNDLINGIKRKGFNIDIEILTEIVDNNDKRRFTFNEDKTQIRANQGHSLKVELDLEELIPPSILYHGTSERYLSNIIEAGITKQSRNFVHLSTDEKIAIEVGKRHGRPVVLIINARRMFDDGIKFYRSKNNVWLTEYVSPMYIINFES